MLYTLSGKWRRNISLLTHLLVHMKIKSTEFIRKHKVEKKYLKLSISKCIGAIQLLWFLFTFCVHYTHNFIFPAFLIGVYGKPSAIKK